jgi:DNA-binding LytR/AlgR family response regulator
MTNNNTLILLVEDEVLPGKVLIQELKNLGYEQVRWARNDKEANAILNKEQLYLAIVDISLKDSDLDGIEIAKRIRQKLAIPIIFLTAFSDLSNIKRAGEVDYFDYLVKPVSSRQLFVVLQRAMLEHSSIKESATPEVAQQNRFFIKKGSDGFADGIHIDEFLYAKAAGGYVDIHTNNQRYTVSATLESFLKQYPHPDIIRIHRSYAVNVRKVIKRGDAVLMMSNEEILPFSRSHKKLVDQFFGTIKSD